MAVKLTRCLFVHLIKIIVIGMTNIVVFCRKKLDFV
jgi:hypothetical protein